MRIYYWNPWSFFDDLDRGPAFDIEDDDDETTLTADLPGMTNDDIELSIHGSTLIVRGERSVRRGRYLRRDRWHGAFERRFQLADGYDLDDIKAQVTNGVLTIRLAKTAKMKPRRIKLGGGVVDRVKGLLSGEQAA